MLHALRCYRYGYVMYSFQMYVLLMISIRFVMYATHSIFLLV